MEVVQLLQELEEVDIEFIISLSPSKVIDQMIYVPLYYIIDI